LAGRPVVLSHGDFAPVNVLIEGSSISGLIDFESTRWADPLFDVAWWHWAVSFAAPSALERGWIPLLEGAGIDPHEPGPGERLRALQVLRMLELLGGDEPLAGGVAEGMRGRLMAELAG
jgi:aminoglycoside phosphotransferase (APT) family kinase protein